MYNLKSENFPLRGKVGELIARSYVPFSSRVQELSPKYLYKRFSFGFIEYQQRNFLFRNWKSFDLIRFVTNNNATKLKHIEVYEVKTVSQGRIHKPEITGKVLSVYRQAEKLGIKPKLLKIVFLDNWDYKITIEDFKEENIGINDGHGKTDNYLQFLKKSAYFHNKNMRGT